MVFTFRARPFHSSYSFLLRYFEDQQNSWHFIIYQYFFNQIGFLSELFWNSVYHPFKAFISIIRYNSRFYSSSIKIGASQKMLPLTSSKMLDIIPKLFSWVFLMLFSKLWELYILNQFRVGVWNFIWGIFICDQSCCFCWWPHRCFILQYLKVKIT